MKTKIPSGSRRDKTGKTAKQNKWNDPHYAKSACGKGGNYHKQWGRFRRMKVKKSPIGR